MGSVPDVAWRGRYKQLVKRLCRRFPSKRLSGPCVEGGRYGCNVVGAMHAKIGAFWKILAQQPVSVLVGAALPWAVRIAEIDLDASVDLQACVLSHLSSLIPSQRLTQLLRQGDHRSRNGVAHHARRVRGRSSREPRGHGRSCAAGAAAE